MELVHPQRNAIISVPPVPYLLCPYSGPTFEAFPKRFANDILVLSDPDDDFDVNYITPFSWTWEQLGFAQAWLYLGLLTEVLNEALGMDGLHRPRLTFEHFIRKEGGESILVTRLDTYIPTWIERVSHLQENNISEFERHKTKIFRMIDASWVFAKRHLTPTRTKDIPNSTVIVVQTSIVVLCSFIDSWASMLYGRRPWNWPSSLMALNSFARICRYDWLRMQAQCTQETLYYMSTLQWPDGLQNHILCDETQCAVNHISEETYRTKHSHCCNGCAMVGPDQAQIEAVLLQGDIPVIRIQDQQNPKRTMFEIGRASEVKYVAISHIWSDGLGNTLDNELPCCQLERLRQMVVSLSTTNIRTFFWVDTLCVPVKVSLRKLAILKMKQTYERASCVLVLDAQLQRMPIKFRMALPDDIALKEAIARIVNSGWMRRLWTFQEGRLAKTLKFQFADGIIDYGDIVFRLFMRPKLMGLGVDLVVYNMIVILMPICNLTSKIDYGQEFYQLSRVIQWPDVHYRMIFNAVSWRSTTKPQDEVICLASMFGIDPGPFLELDVQEHIPRLLLGLHYVPVSLAFTPGERHQKPGFRWCPKSFLNSRQRYVSELPSKLAECTEFGLKATLPGWTLRPSTLRTTPTQRGFSWRIKDPRWNHSPVYFIYHRFRIEDQIKNQQLAILTKPGAGICEKPIIGIFVALSHKEQNEVFGRFLGHATISKDDQTEKELQKEKKQILQGWTFSTPQRWCIF